LADHLSLNDAVRWLDWIPHDEVPQLYKSHDVLLFPSLHDSSGNVVLEALSQSLPVVCLDLGGPAEIVTQGCGRVIVTKRREEPEVVTDLALALAELAEDSALLANLREGAVQRAREFSWGSVVSAVYGANSRSGYEMDAAALN
jgi:glycosyltransferase involved in cell wall biosynthesis